MTRPLRIEFPGALVHVTSRGIDRKNIVADDDDRRRLLDLIGEAVERSRWIVHQYVLMTNHYHFVLRLTENSLSKGMQWLNSQYARAFNRRHGRVGYLLQGRFDSRLIQDERYLLEVLRYDALNPVRAQMVEAPADYEWCGHRAIAGLCDPPPWLAVDQTLRCFAPDRFIAREYYSRFVLDGIGGRSPWDGLVGQIYLGDEGWVHRMREKFGAAPLSDEHPAIQRHPPTTSMTEVICAVASVLSVPETAIRSGRGGAARMLCAWLGQEAARCDLRTIAAALSVRSRSGVSRLVSDCRTRTRSNPEWRQVAERCEAALRVVEKVQFADVTP